MKVTSFISSRFVIIIAATIPYVLAVDVNTNNGSLRGTQNNANDHHQRFLDVSTFPEGQAIVCFSDEQKIHRWTGGELRWYPNGLVASSWDNNWRSYMEVDCEALNMPFGEPMKQNITLPDEGSIMCVHDESTIYYWNVKMGVLRKYPNPRIAKKWQRYWFKFILVDCIGLGLQFGKELTAGIPEQGTIVSCNGHGDKVYIVDGGVLRWFPNSSIAASWKLSWRRHMVRHDCEFLPFGEDMEVKLVDGVPEDGSIVRCLGGDGKIYIMDNGVLRWFSSPKIASSWDVFWRSEIIKTDCTSLSVGEDMPMRARGLSKEDVRPLVSIWRRHNNYRLPVSE